MGRSPSPGYRRQKRKSGDLAFVELSGVRHYLGAYGTDASRAEYHRLVAEWEANGRTIEVAPEAITIAELTLRFLDWAGGYYRRADGTPTGEAQNFRTIAQPLVELYGDTLAAAFGPRALKAVRQYLIKRGLARTTINKEIHRLRLIFKWAAQEELLDAAVYTRLQAVSGLRRGRSEAREPEAVRPVAMEHAQAVRPYVSRQVWALIELQILTAARSGEILPMRAVDLDTSGEVWTYSPPQHKTAHHGHERVILLGPAAQRILRPFLKDRALSDPLFSPREAERERREALGARRKTPLSCGNRPGTNRRRSPRLEPGEVYTTASYRRAIARACTGAGIPIWHPHQLRHARATEIRRVYGLETARVILGHRSASVTEIYAELDRQKAMDVVQDIG